MDSLDRNDSSEPKVRSLYDQYSNGRPAADVDHSTALKHSGYGITAFVLSIVSTLALFLFSVAAAVIAAEGDGAIDEESMAIVMVGWAIIFSFLGLIVALILGIVGLFQKNKKKIFSILGVVFPVLTLMLFMVLLLIGLATNAG